MEGRSRLVAAVWPRVLVTAAVLMAWRVLAQVPVPGVDPRRGVSVLFMGLSPYAYALAVATLAMIISATVRKHAGSQRRWRRWLTAAIALAEAGQTAIQLRPDWLGRVAVVLALAAGTMLLMWLGEILDEHGLGFGGGVLILYALESLFSHVAQIATVTYVRLALKEADALLPALVWALLTVVVVALTVLVLEAVRWVPLESPGGRGRHRSGLTRSRLPLRLLVSGVLIPRVMAFSAFALVLGFAETNPWMARYWHADGPNVLVDAAYAAVYGLLVLLSVYFLTATRSDAAAAAHKIASFHTRIPGIPAGPATVRVLYAIHTRLALIGGTFLAVAVAVVPPVAAGMTGVPVREAYFDAPALVLLVALLLAGRRPLEKLIAADA